jgi:hypothetical protein
MYWDFVCKHDGMYWPKFVTWAPIPIAVSVKWGQLNVASKRVGPIVDAGTSSESGINCSVRPVDFYREKPRLTIEIRETLFAGRQRKSTRQVA